MDIANLLGQLVEHNKTNKGYQIHLNSGDLDDKSNRNTGVEFSDLYFTECSILNKSILSFGNANRQPESKKEDGTNLYPIETNSEMFIDLKNIEYVEEVKDIQDWFIFPSEKIFNIYLFPENDNIDGHRNIVTVGFME